MKRLRLTPEAELDLDEAHAWYLEQRPGLGGQFLRAVDACIGAILRHPEAYQLVDRKMRRALLRRFPYAVFFEVGEAESLFTQSSIVQGTRAVGNADATHNRPLQRTGCAGR